MGGMYGADVAQLRALAEQFNVAADEIERAGRVLAQDIATTASWHGPDAVSFRGAWNSSHHPRVTSATSALRAAARTVRLNADQQDRASAVEGGQAALGAAVAGAAGALSGILSGLFGDRKGGSIPRPPSGTSPDEANAWWRGLSESQQEEVIAKHPDWIGNRDGIPAAARDKANQSLIQEYRKDLEEERDELKSALSNNIFGKHGLGFLSGLATNQDRALDIVEAKLEALARVEETLAQGGRQLLLLDTSNEHVHAAIAVGDVDAAQHVAVFVPGLASSVEEGLVAYDGDMARLQALAEAESSRYGDGGTVATVTWLGYEAPQWNGVLDGQSSVLRDALAREGAADLAAFYGGINAARDPDPHLTALGHSYGSTTTGIALQSDTGVDDLVVFGSPGIGAGDLSALRIPDGHAYRIEAENDFVADSGTFGADPSQVPGMIGLSAEHSGIDSPLECKILEASSGHSEYLTPGTTSQHNIASIVAGLPERAVHG